MGDEITVLHVVAGLHPDAGGPSRSVVGLTDSLAGQRGTRVALMVQSRSGAPLVRQANPAVERVVVEKGVGLTAEMGLSMRRELAEWLRVRGPDLVHAHGIWTAVNHWTAQCTRRAGIPLAIHPRGMLEPWALAYRGWKKRLALMLYQRRDLERPAVLFATTEQEAVGFRRFGLRQPIAVIPNGVELNIANEPGRQAMKQAKVGLRKALFLSRIHPVKNVLNLLDAWAALDSPEWFLQLAGPDEDGHLAEVRQRMSALGLHDRVRYLGSIDDAHKGAVYAAADLFILPSFSENFGVVVAEALSHGLPVIATRGTPWQGLELHGCGWWVEPTVEGLAGALRDAMAKESEQLREMGMRGQVYAREFDWANIARQTAEVYRWVLGQGDRPDCVVFD